MLAMRMLRRNASAGELRVLLLALLIAVETRRSPKARTMRLLDRYTLRGAAAGEQNEPPSNGLSRAAAVHLLPQAEVFAIYLIMTLVLIVRPYGLLGHERLRKV